MTVREKIINQLLKENEYSLEGKEIDFNCSKLSKELSIDRSNAIDIKKKLIQSGEIVELENKKYKFTNPSNYKYNYSYLVENIDVVKEKDLSDSELKVLGYLHYNYSKFGNPFKLGLEKIVNNVGISKNYETNSTIIQKLEDLKLI
jgi:viroplasmin and RNaseH domain-containing protein